MTTPDAATSVTHFVDEDWGPLCRNAAAGDLMWAFYDDQVTCPRCREQLAREFPEGVDETS